MCIHQCCKCSSHLQYYVWTNFLSEFTWILINTSVCTLDAYNNRSYCFWTDGNHWSWVGHRVPKVTSVTYCNASLSPMQKETGCGPLCVLRVCPNLSILPSSILHYTYSSLKVYQILPHSQLQITSKFYLRKLD